MSFIYSAWLALTILPLTVMTISIYISQASRRRQARRCSFSNYVEATLSQKQISLFGTDHFNRKLPFSKPFCKILYEDYFRKSIEDVSLEKSELSKIADYYDEYIYNPKRFDITYRNRNESDCNPWFMTDNLPVKNCTGIYMNFTESDVKNYYSRVCPGRELRFIEKLMIWMVTLLLFIPIICLMVTPPRRIRYG